MSLAPKSAPRKTVDTHAIVAAIGVIAGTFLAPVTAAVNSLSLIVLHAPLDPVMITIVSGAATLFLAAITVGIARALGIAPAQVESDVLAGLRQAPTVIYQVENLTHEFHVSKAVDPSVPDAAPTVEKSATS